MIYLKLFWNFFKVSCFTFGGGYGAIPLMRDLVLGNGWVTEEQFAYMLAISESTPGPIMINMATYIGSDQAGFFGSLLATTAVVLPAYLAIILVVCIMKNAIENKYVQAVLQGLKPCVVGIVLAMGVYLVVHNFLLINQGLAIDIQALIITAVLVAIMLVYQRITEKKFPPIGLIVCSAVLGIVVFGI